MFISVGALAKVDLVWERILEVLCRQRKDGI